jgi:antitoxin component YwqK of YwqJK toxin-antitoxin module
MADRVLFLTSLFIISAIGYWLRPADPIPQLNIATADLKSVGGNTYLNNKLCSANFFRLSADGDTLETRSYINGREDGAWKRYYEDGRLESIYRFKNGRKEGTAKIWWPNGELKSEYPFVDDEYEGNCRDWSAEGTLTRSMHYRHGHEQGLQQMWKSDGTLWANYKARNGRNYGKVGVKGCATLWQGDSLVSHQ